MQRALMAKWDSSWDLFNKFGVVGVGVGFKRIGGEVTDEPCVVVSVVRKLPKVSLLPSELVPSSVWGVRTDVVETGVIVALNDRTGRWRPAPGGVSIGHVDVTAGTLGCLVKRNGETMILSNNHVLANANQGKQGDPIVQPGAYDGGLVPDDVIAELYDYVPVNVIEATDCQVSQALVGGLNAIARLLGSRVRLEPLASEVGLNQVDAAIARPLNEDDVDSTILEIGQPGILEEAQLGMAVKKSGRTTGLTSGVITQVDMTVTVQYPPAGVAIFTEQIASDLHCEGGDSGSLVLGEDNATLALLFAGGTGVSIFNQASLVAAMLGVSFG